jgi:hypothetical protein
MNDFRMILYPYTLGDHQKQYAIFVESSHVKPFIGTKFGDVLFFYIEDGEYSIYFSEGYDKIKVIGVDEI